jgi:hypothetical protein
MPLVVHPTGNYRFLPGIDPYSCGVVAAEGHEIVHVALADPPPYDTGFERIAAFLSDAARPKSALCAVELRSPLPFTFAGFAEFNGRYARILQEWGVFVDGVNPIARTNVAPEFSPPAEPVLFGFSFTQPAKTSRPTFVVAGAGELPEGKLDRDSVIALDDVTLRGLATKADFVLDLMERRLAGLGVRPEWLTAINVYTAHDLNRLLAEPLLSRLSAGRRIGVRWHFTRPPIVDIEFEMDVRGVRTEFVLD